MHGVRGMICILHGYLLDGSGSNLWTRSVVRALVRDGATIHLVCQEPHPEKYDFISEAYEYPADGTRVRVLERDTGYAGRCIMHQPVLGRTLPVYVWDEYEEFDRVVPMVEMDDVDLEDYIHRNVAVVTRLVREHGITVMHANHALLMSVVAQRVSAWTGVPYAVMPHGSALEYAVKPDERLRRLAADAFDHASAVFAISDEVSERAAAMFGDAVADLDSKLSRLDLGVDTSAFRPIEPTARPGNIERITGLLESVERGRTAAQGDVLIDGLAAGRAPAVVYEHVGEYAAKLPDADVEAKLATIDWSTDQVIVFVGRLIAAKGIHAVMAALPLIAAQAPRARLLVVGHGPLREPLEAFAHALTQGDRQLAAQILAHAATISAGEPEHLEAVHAFWDSLEERGELDAYWDAAARFMKPDTVVFTGYLTHREMAWLLPCCDVAIFPSMVVESGPLVFLEALASGVFPIGTYWGGMKVKIDRTAPSLEDDAELMKVRPEAASIVGDIAAVVPAALQVAARYRTQLRSVAENHYDWGPVARRLQQLLERVAQSAAAPDAGGRTAAGSGAR